MGSFFFFDSIFINFINYSGIYIEFESLINIFSFSNKLPIINNNTVDLLFLKNKELLYKLDDINIRDSYKFVFLSKNGTIPLYQKYLDYDLLNNVPNNTYAIDSFVNKLKIGIFEKNTFIEKNLYLDIIKPILVKAQNKFEAYINLLEQANLYVELPAKGEVIYSLNEDHLVALFKNTYGNPEAFFTELSLYKMVDQNNILIKGKNILNFINVKGVQETIVNALDNIINKHNNIIKETKVNTKVVSFSLLNFVLVSSNDMQISLYIKILPLVVSLLGFSVYYLLDDRFILYYHNYYYRLLVLKFYNGLFFDKLFIDVLVSKFYLFSYYSFYKNIESSFFQKYNIYIFEKNVFSLFFFFKIFSKGYFFVYILIVLCFMYFYFLFLFILKFLNYSFIPLVLILFIFSFIFKWNILKDFIKNFLMKNLNDKN